MFYTLHTSARHRSDRAPLAAPLPLCRLASRDLRLVTGVWWSGSSDMSTRCHRSPHALAPFKMTSGVW
eukprot:scaffold49569_cov69-Phaeocystis_antarctica.AAC.2